MVGWLGRSDGCLRTPINVHAYAGWEPGQEYLLGKECVIDSRWGGSWMEMRFGKEIEHRRRGVVFMEDSGEEQRGLSCWSYIRLHPEGTKEVKKKQIPSITFRVRARLISVTLRKRDLHF